MDTRDRAAAILRADAIFDLGVAVLLVLDTWDGLYDALDLPQALPALFAQIGGVALAALGWLLWVAPRSAELTRLVATAAAGANAAAAGVIAAWLIFRDPSDDLGIDTLGTVLLIGAAVVLAAFALLEARLAGPPRRSA